MIEREWLATGKPAWMMRHLLEEERDGGSVGIYMSDRDHPLTSHRKLRLFVLACFPGEPKWIEWANNSHDMTGYLSTINAARFAAGQKVRMTTPQLTVVERHHRANLLRDIVGNPFAPITWKMPDGACFQSDLFGLAYGMAKEIYEGSSNVLDATSMSILADALTDAGCECTALIEHLRTPGPHVRGCHALDIILGLE